MCFFVDKRIKRLKIRTGYKLLHPLLPDVFESPFYPKKYKLGRVACASRGATTWRNHGNTASRGIYVYTTLAAAKREELGCAIVRVKLDPADFLHASALCECNGTGRVATYRKIVPVAVVR